MPLPKPRKGEKEDDFVSRCMDNSTMKSEYPDQEQRLAVCYQKFGAKSNTDGTHKATANSSQFFYIQSEVQTSQVRRETFHGTEHLVVPMVILVEGVLWPANAPAPELALADEFGRFPQGWDGRPVVLNHPVIDGVPVSANSPRVLEQYAMGFLFNTRVKDSKLLSEAWINLDRVSDLGGEFEEAVVRLEAGDTPVEVSTGLFSMNEEAAGDYNGTEYSAIWRNIVPDHLAILPEGVKGACSVEDGCGAPRVSGAAFVPGSPAGPGNFFTTKPTEAAMSKAAKLNSQCSCNGEHKCDKCQQAAAAVLQNEGATPNQGNPETQEGIFKSLVSRFGKLLSFRSNQNELSDRDTRTALEIALSAQEPDQYHYILAIFDDYFVYEAGWDYELLSRGYSISTDGTITLMDETTQVRPVTTFVPLETGTPGAAPTMSESNEEIVMKREETIAALIANEQAPFDESDKDYLTALEDGKLNALAEKFSEQSSESVEVTDNTAETAESPNNDGVTANSAQPATVEEYINSAPEGMRDVLRASFALHQEKRTTVISKITANKRNKFSKEQLERMDDATLENLAAIAGETVDYSGAGAGALNIQSSGDNSDDAVPAPPKMFAVPNQAS